MNVAQIASLGLSKAGLPVEDQVFDRVINAVRSAFPKADMDTFRATLRESGVRGKYFSTTSSGKAKSSSSLDSWPVQLVFWAVRHQELDTLGVDVPLPPAVAAGLEALAERSAKAEATV